MNTNSGLILLLFLVIVVVFTFLSCTMFDPCQQKEIHRITSQDDIVDVVLLKKDCGATTSISNMIYIVPKGGSIRKIEPIFVADHIRKLEVKWVKPKLLTISYAEARIFGFTNFWHSKKVNNFMYEVTIHEFQKIP